MSTVVQPCARCGARWAVQTTPMHWCPRCRGVLLSPAPIDAPAERRNYRWVARRPDQRAAKRSSPRPSGSRGTPRYQEIPRWGLIDPPATPSAAPQRPFGWFGNSVGILLIITAAAFALAACAELGRYLILLHNRTTLIAPWLLWFSDAAVIGFAIGASVFALAAALGMLSWLIETRGVAFTKAGRRDPRSVRTLALGSLIPVVNLVWPGVFLTETVSVAAGSGEPDPRALRAVRFWWCAWVVGALFTVAALVWRTADSLQAEADGVLFTALADLVAAGVALVTLWMMRSIGGRDLLGRTRVAHRWVVAVDPVPVIEPVQPGARAAQRDAAVADIPADTAEQADTAKQEVMAK